jgi:transcription elongation factor GreB
MSRAFVRESDDSDNDLNVPVRPQLPPGIPNRITPEGARQLQERLAGLLENKQRLVQAESQTTESEAQLRKAQSDIRQLQSIIESIVVTPAPSSNRDRVCFGAKVVVTRSNEHEATYRIVGTDEADFDRGYISWRSPLARSLLSKREGNRVQFDSPSGLDEFVIKSISYD